MHFVDHKHIEFVELTTDEGECYRRALGNPLGWSMLMGSSWEYIDDQDECAKLEEKYSRYLREKPNYGC